MGPLTLHADISMFYQVWELATDQPSCIAALCVGAAGHASCHCTTIVIGSCKQPKSWSVHGGRFRCCMLCQDTARGEGVGWTDLGLLPPGHACRSRVFVAPVPSKSYDTSAGLGGTLCFRSAGYDHDNAVHTALLLVFAIPRLCQATTDRVLVPLFLFRSSWQDGRQVRRHGDPGLCGGCQRRIYDQGSPRR